MRVFDTGDIRSHNTSTVLKFIWAENREPSGNCPPTRDESFDGFEYRQLS